MADSLQVNSLGSLTDRLNVFADSHRTALIENIQLNLQIVRPEGISEVYKCVNDWEKCIVGTTCTCVESLLVTDSLEDDAVGKHSAPMAGTVQKLSKIVVVCRIALDMHFLEESLCLIKIITDRGQI